LRRVQALQFNNYQKKFNTGSQLAALSTLSGNRAQHEIKFRPCHSSVFVGRGAGILSAVPVESPPCLLIQQRRGCANVSGNLTLPPLMDAPPIMWPKIINTFRNWIFTVFVIRPHMDREFSLTEFDKGARQALTYISSKLSKGEFEDLEDVVDPAALEEIKRNMANFSMAQREMLAVEPEDIFFSFPFEIGIIIPDDQPSPKQYMEGQRPPQVRHVEITYVFHVLRGMAREHEDLANKTFKEFLESDETKKRVMVCNYRFFRDFTEGRDPRWIVNVVNHFLPADLGQRSR
jgi:hypothetical protein